MALVPISKAQIAPRWAKASDSFSTDMFANGVGARFAVAARVARFDCSVPVAGVYGRRGEAGREVAEETRGAEEMRVRGKLDGSVGLRKTIAVDVSIIGGIKKAARLFARRQSIGS